MESARFSAILKKARENAGLTQKQVYEKIGVVQSTFSSWETGKAEPPAEVLINLCLIYGIEDISYFYEAFGIEKKNAPKITSEALKIAVLYDEATDDDKKVIHAVLDKYEEKRGASPAKNDVKREIESA